MSTDHRQNAVDCTNNEMPSNTIDRLDAIDGAMARLSDRVDEIGELIKRHFDAVHERHEQDVPPRTLAMWRTRRFIAELIGGGPDDHLWISDSTVWNLHMARAGWAVVDKRDVTWRKAECGCWYGDREDGSGLSSVELAGSHGPIHPVGDWSKPLRPQRSGTLPDAGPKPRSA